MVKIYSKEFKTIKVLWGNGLHKLKGILFFKLEGELTKNAVWWKRYFELEFE
jgi:hypothetical protein